MKSYNHLWEIFISDANIEDAIRKAKIGKSKRDSVIKYLQDSDFPKKIKDYAYNFHNYKHRPIEIYDGIQRKKRIIIVPTFPEQVIHHMVVNVLKPIFMKSMYYHSYGSIPYRGAHKGKKYIKKWLVTDRKNCKYCLKMDIQKYFDSIPHDIYLRKLRKLIHDEKFMNVLEEITNVISQGLPLGFYTSQWTANWYLEELDYFIKEKLHAKYYIRYMDDMVIFGNDKTKLHQMRKEIADYIQENLGLKMKDNWQVFLFDTKKDGNRIGRFLDFMGFRFYHDKITLRKSIMVKATRKANKIHKMDKITVYAARQMLSYLGWIKCTDTYNMYKRFIKSYVDFQYLKYRVSVYDKKENRRIKNELVQNV